MKKKKFLVDSNVIISAYQEDNSLHEAAVELLHDYKYQPKIVNYWVYEEILTILLYRSKNKKLLKQVIEDLNSKKIHHFKIAPISSKLFQATNSKFFIQSKRLSFTDCSLLAQAELVNARILTFDKQLQKAMKVYST